LAIPLDSARQNTAHSMRDIIDPMRKKRRSRAFRTAMVVAVCALAACHREKPEPILVEDRAVKVHNETAERWTEVRIWLNDHYVAGTPVLEPNGRITVQQRDFVAGLGQKFDPSRQSPYGVLVTAKSPSGDVRLIWGTPYKKQ
jgi:hypothetical protein